MADRGEWRDTPNEVGWWMRHDKNGMGPTYIDDNLVGWYERHPHPPALFFRIDVPELPKKAS